VGTLASLSHHPQTGSFQALTATKGLPGRATFKTLRNGAAVLVETLGRKTSKIAHQIFNKNAF